MVCPLIIPSCRVFFYLQVMYDDLGIPHFATPQVKNDNNNKTDHSSSINNQNDNNNNDDQLKPIMMILIIDSHCDKKGNVFRFAGNYLYLLCRYNQQLSITI